MTIYFKNGFYHDHAPDGAVEIDEQTYLALLDGQAQGKEIAADDAGYPVLLEPRPSAYHTLQNGVWTISPDGEAKLLAEAKADKLRQLNAAAQAYIDHAAHLAQTPDFEIRTWVMQAAEAKAWASDQTAPTPVLDTIAAARGVPAALLKQKALEKAQAFELLTATVAGQRQALEDKIHAATHTAALDAIRLHFGSTTQHTGD